MTLTPEERRKLGSPSRPKRCVLFFHTLTIWEPYEIHGPYGEKGKRETRRCLGCGKTWDREVARYFG